MDRGSHDEVLRSGVSHPELAPYPRPAVVFS